LDDLDILLLVVPPEDLSIDGMARSIDSPEANGYD
jgi:hypothetical protein